MGGKSYSRAEDQPVEHSPDEGSKREHGVIHCTANNHISECVREFAAYLERESVSQRDGRAETGGCCYARMVDTANQPAAAMSPPKRSWQKEMRNAPRRNGRQQRKWRAGMSKNGGED